MYPSLPLLHGQDQGGPPSAGGHGSKIGKRAYSKEEEKEKEARGKGVCHQAARSFDGGGQLGIESLDRSDEEQEEEDGDDED